MSILISGVGAAVPDRIVTNDDIERRIRTTTTFVVERTGVHTRRHVMPEGATSSLMVTAARRAMANAGIDPADIDFLMVNTLSPDHHDPSQACLIQPLLGTRTIPALDLRAQCSGFLYGLQMARALLRSREARHVLVICGEVLSKRMDCSDAGRNLSIMLGDGSGAAVVSHSPRADFGLMDVMLGADGREFDLLMTAAPGTAGKRFIDADDVACGRTEFVMQGRRMFEHATDTLVRTAGTLLQRNRMTLGDITHVICHQPNLRILEAVRERIGIDAERMPLTVSELGNMGSASLPVTLAMHWPAMAHGDIAMLLAYGAGATWGGALYRHWNPQ
ncbi:MAG: beta-ketoacyl-ACP synthase 3 [Cupriavidus sp.]|nr:beta-ketoacyl-ACP synthase 3 [Cupriavidus sp.]